MYLASIRKIALLITITLFFTACIPKGVEVYQQGDQLLNCNQLTTEIADLIDNNYDINENTGISLNSVAKWYIFTPLGVYNQFRASGARDTIDERLNYLINLKKENNCTFTYREIAFNMYKGRVSEDLIKMKKEYDESKNKPSYKE